MRAQLSRSRKLEELKSALMRNKNWTEEHFDYPIFSTRPGFDEAKYWRELFDEVTKYAEPPSLFYMLNSLVRRGFF
jgi:hypothetical protein